MTPTATMATTARRERYLADSITTASPARLITMLYDRLVRDLDEGTVALRDGEHASARAAIDHGVEILFELRASLMPDEWSGGPALASLYTFLVRELIAAMVAKDADKVATCRQLVEPLADAWHEAAA